MNNRVDSIEAETEPQSRGKGPKPLPTLGFSSKNLIYRNIGWLFHPPELHLLLMKSPHGVPQTIQSTFLIHLITCYETIHTNDA